MTLSALTTPRLKTPHGFFTRAGGASSGIYKGLNCGLGSNDQRDTVVTNRARVADHMGVAADHLVSVYQIHSPRVVDCSGHWGGDTPEADALVTTQKGVALGVLSADCAPVLFAGNGVVGAAHAGWKGALGGVLSATADRMWDLGADRITAVVGPCISQKAYEVGPEFVDTFLAEDQTFDRFFAQGQEDRLQFDLPSFCLHQLREAGVDEALWIGHCTYTDPARFFSYRRSCHQKESDYGRLISVIRL